MKLKIYLNKIRMNELELITSFEFSNIRFANISTREFIKNKYNINSITKCDNCNHKYDYHGIGNLACQTHTDELGIERIPGYNCFKSGEKIQNEK